MALVQFAVPDQPHAPYRNVQSTGTLSMELVRFAVPDLPQLTEPDPGRNVQPSLSMALFKFSVPDLKLSSWRFNLWLHFFTGLQFVVWELRDTVIRIRIYSRPVIYRMIVSEEIYSLIIQLCQYPSHKGVRIWFSLLFSQCIVRSTYFTAAIKSFALTRQLTGFLSESTHWHVLLLLVVSIPNHYKLNQAIYKPVSISCISYGNLSQV